MLDTPFVDALIGVSRNLAILTCGVAAYCWVRRGPLEDRNWPKIAAETLILGGVGTYSMINAATPTAGVILDARPIMIALAALFSDALVAAPLTIWLILVRLWIGGVGTTPGIFEALIGFAFINAYREWLGRRGLSVGLGDLTIASVMITLPAFGTLLFLPWEISQSFMTRLNLGVLLGWNMIGLTILGTLIIWDDRLKYLQLDLADGDARFRDVIDNLPVSLAMRDRGGRVTLLNRCYCEIYGPEVAQFVGQDLNQLRQFVYSGDAYDDSQGDERVVEVTGQPTRRYRPALMTASGPKSMLVTTFRINDALGEMESLAVIGVDVSELSIHEREMERLQSHLVQAGKMEAIGQLAGGIAHDFNNLLGAIGGFAGFLAEDLADQSASQSHANRILGICERAKYLVGQVLALARTNREDRDIIDIHRVITETLNFLRMTLPPTTTLQFDSNEPIWLNANEGQISQLIINLAINCSQAFEGAPGRISINLRRFGANDVGFPSIGHAAVNRHAVGTLHPDRDYVRITIDDDGRGVDQTTLEHLMEPFFIVLDNRDGSGLGLSIVHSIILAYEGAYAIESSIGAGTRFTIFLPDTETARNDRMMGVTKAA